MIYHKSNIRSFFSHYVACASLIVLTLWVILDVVFVKFFGVCVTHEASKAHTAPSLECHTLDYRIHSQTLKWFDTAYAPEAFLGRAFKLWDEARHNIDGLCGKPFGGAATKAHCGEVTAIGYAENVSLLLFYVWGPLVVVWLLLKKIFTRKVPTYAAH